MQGEGAALRGGTMRGRAGGRARRRRDPGPGLVRGREGGLGGGTAAGSRRDPCKGVEARGQCPSVASAGEGAVCRTLASGLPASALPWDPAASRPQLFPALPLALRSSQSTDVPRIREPGARGTGLWLLPLLLSWLLFVSTFPSSFLDSLLVPLSLSLCL